LGGPRYLYLRPVTHCGYVSASDEYDAIADGLFCGADVDCPS
jgi:hypothetical protein